MAKTNKTIDTKYWQSCGKGEPSFTIDVAANQLGHSGNRVENSQRAKINQPHDPSRPLLSMCPKDSDSYSITPARPWSLLLTITRKRKQPHCPSAEQWVMKACYMYRMEYYLAIKRNEIMAFAGEWKKLENITLVNHKEGNFPWALC